MARPLLLGIDIGGGGGRFFLVDAERGLVRRGGCAWSLPVTPGTGGFGFDIDADEFFAKLGATCREIVAALPSVVHVSFDIDGLDPALCPNTGTPVPGGLNWHEACHLLWTLATSGRRVVGFDLVEVAPGPRGDDWDGNVGARLLYKLAGCAWRSSGA